MRRTFLRGLNPIFMESYDGKAIGLGAGRGFNPRLAQYLRVRRSLGYALTLSDSLGGEQYVTGMRIARLQ